MKRALIHLIILLLAPLAGIHAAETAVTGSAAVKVLRVADFGAVPDDGKCDLQAIATAIQTAIAKGATEIRFDPGNYNLKTTAVASGARKASAYLHFLNATNLALVGACDSNGKPATRLERNVPLNNEASPPCQLAIESSHGIAIKNFTLANNPPFGTTARVVSSDKAADEVVVEVLDGLPAYDGMRCASAHAWNLATGELKRFGSTPTEATLTIGTTVNVFWQAVAGTNARRLKMSGRGFAAKLEAGDGISWHLNARDLFNQTSVMRSQDVVFENIIMPNVTQMGMLAGYNHNLTFRRVRFEPENGNLAVGSRDGLHLSMNSGRILVEDCLFKGLRMDPLVFRVTFGLVKAIPAENAVLVSPGFTVPAGDAIRFWVGTEPQDRVCTKCEKQPDGSYRYTFAKPIPRETAAGTPVTFRTYAITEGTVRRCVFEENFGSAIVNFEENITVEDCIFSNNSYQIKYGANDTSGAFVRNNIFRNNLISNVSWIDIAHRGSPACLTIHSLSKFFKEPTYNQHILIEGNVFKNPYHQQNAAAIHVRNAMDVEIRSNRFEGFGPEVWINAATTRDIRLDRASRAAGK